jgi:hypothetical protein
VNNQNILNKGFHLRMSTRRKFLRDCSLAAAATSLVPAISTTVLADTAPRAISGEQPGFKDYLQQINTLFAVNSGIQQVALTLVEAKTFTAASTTGIDARNEKFSLLFRGPLSRPLEQNTYTLDHSRLGSLPIFIVPVGCRNKRGKFYEAIFDRPVNAEDLAIQLSSSPDRRTSTSS